MPRTFVRQYQSNKSDTYLDNLLSGQTALETDITDLEGDLNALRSQLKRVGGETKWYDALSGRDLKTTASDLLDIENKKLLFRTQVITDITVTAAQNWEVLSVAGLEAPTEVAAVGAGTANGAVVAVLADTEIGSHKLTMVTGPNALNPKNLVLVRDAATDDPIISGGKAVYGLLQAQFGVVDGNAFDDATKKVQISFVRETAASPHVYEACPVADIAGKTINYAYVLRTNLDAVPESAFLSGVFADQSASVDVTLENAVDNQGATPVTQATDIDIQIADTKGWAFQEPGGVTDIFKVGAESAGDYVNFNVATFDVNNTNAADFLNGAIFDSGGTAITIGDTAGVISSAGKLDLSSASATDLSLLAGGQLVFSDSYYAGSTYDTPLVLSDSSQEWSNFETAFGEVSLLNAITQAYTKSKHDKMVGATTGQVTANTNVSGATAPINLDATLLDYTGKTFVDDVDVYLNGVLLRNGADATANHDVYPGTDITKGDLKFEFPLKPGDQITMVVY